MLTGLFIGIFIHSLMMRMQIWEMKNRGAQVEYFLVPYLSGLIFYGSAGALTTQVAEWLL